MDQIFLMIGVTFLLFGVVFRVFLFTNYSRQVLHDLEQELRKRLEEGSAEAVSAVEEEIILLTRLTPAYARFFIRFGVVAILLYYLTKIFG